MNHTAQKVWYGRKSMLALEVMTAPHATKEWEWQDVYTFDSSGKTGPQTVRRAVFSHPHEYHMGAYMWSLSLYEGEQDVSLEHPQVTGGVYYHLPISCDPWCMGGDVLVLSETGSKGKLLFYLWDDKRLHRTNLSAMSANLVASSSLPRVVTDCRRDSPPLLLDLNGKEVAHIDIHERDSLPFLAWMADGRHLLGLSHSAKNGPATLKLFDGMTGRLMDEAPCDPLDLVPYDHEKYRCIDRVIGFPLITGPNSGSMGCLLDDWRHVSFVKHSAQGAQNVLAMRVYRPKDVLVIVEGRYKVPVGSWHIELLVSLRG